MMVSWVGSSLILASLVFPSPVEQAGQLPRHHHHRPGHAVPIQTYSFLPTQSFALAPSAQSFALAPSAQSFALAPSAQSFALAPSAQSYADALRLLNRGQGAGKTGRP